MNDEIFNAIVQANRQARKAQQAYETQVLIRWLVILATGGFILIRMIGA